MANNKEAFDLMVAADPGSSIIPQERNVALPGMLMAGAKAALSMKDPMQGVLKYLNETAVNEEDYKYLKEKAGLIGSDEWTAMAPFTRGVFAIDNLITGKRGTYRGQDRGRTPEEEAEFISRTGLKRSPHLLDVYLGNTTPEAEGMQKIEGTESYNANPYVDFKGFVGSPSDRHRFLKAVTTLKSGKSVNPKDYNINISSVESIDFGRKGWKVEKDNEGQAFIVLDDKWDFAGSDYGAVGKIMDKIGARDINLKAKFPLNRGHFDYYELRSSEWKE